MLCLSVNVRAQYFNIETSLLHSINFKNSKAESVFKTSLNRSELLETVLTQLNTFNEDSLACFEDQANLTILKALDALRKNNIKSALLSAVYAQRNAIKSNDPLIINNSNLLQTLINFRLNAFKKALEELNLCNYDDPTIAYQVNYLKAQSYYEIHDFNNSNQVLLDLIPVSKTISHFDYIKCLSFLVSNASQNNDDALSLIYALKLDTILKETNPATPREKLLNSKIDYNINETENFAGYLSLQKIINANNIGFLYRKLGDYRNSEKYLEQSISDLKKYKNEDLFPEIKTNIGLTYTHLKKYTEADINYNDALKRYIKLKNTKKQTETYNIIAKNYFLSNNSLSAIQNCNSAIEISLENKDYLNLSNAYFILSEVYALNSDYQQSQTYFKLFTEAKNKYNQDLNDRAKALDDNESKAILARIDAEDEISEREKKGLELVRIKLESKQKEQELLLIKQENEIKEKTIIAQSLEKEQALRSLELIRGQLENEKLIQEYEKINKEKEIKGLENEKNKNQIKLLNSQKKVFINEKAIKDLEIQNTRKNQQYLLFGLVLVGFFLALISFGFYKNYRQRKVIEITNTKLGESVNEINNQKNIIEDKNIQIIDSINYSLRIQQSFLFKEEKMVEYFKDCFIISKPRDIVSGDFYLVTKKEHKIYIAVVDCTGHGVPGALISVIGYEEIKHLIEYNNYTLPEILTKLNNKINEKLNSGNAIGSDGMDLMLVEVDTHKKEIKFCGARGVCLFYSNNQFLEIKGDRKSIGEKEDVTDFEFTQYVYPYEPNDMLYLFTDGFSDQFGIENKKKMGSKLFRTTLSDVKNKPLNDQKQTMESLLVNWQGNAKQTDDITLLGIKL